MRHLINLLFLFISLGSFAQIDRIEPPFWWSDMENSKLQLMIYGKDISKFDLKLDKGVLTNVAKTENPNYIFATVDLENVGPGNLKITFKNAKTSFSKEYQIKERRKNSALRKGFDSSDAIYLIMPDRFANGDPSNDSHKKMIEKADRTKLGGRHGGDIKGVINNLDYLEELGVTALWIINC
jgi:neopullulanase